jgi:hypothetical protein
MSLRPLQTLSKNLRQIYFRAPCPTEPQCKPGREVTNREDIAFFDNRRFAMFEVWAARGARKTRPNRGVGWRGGGWGGGVGGGGCSPYLAARLYRASGAAQTPKFNEARLDKKAMHAIHW